LAYGHFLLNAQRLASIGGLYIVFQFTQSFTIAGLSSVVPSGVVSILLNRRYQERNFAFSALNSYVIAIKGNFKHCFTASAFVLSNSLVSQGITMILAWKGGAAEVVLFNAYRIVGRPSLQLSTLLNQSTWPRCAELHSLKNSAGAARIHSRTS